MKPGKETSPELSQGRVERLCESFFEKIPTPLSSNLFRFGQMSYYAGAQAMFYEILRALLWESEPDVAAIEAIDKEFTDFISQRLTRPN
jgi:hypothetical protein